MSLVPIASSALDASFVPVRVFIYALLDPRTGEARYIGKSHRSGPRLREHINEPPSHCHRSRWIQSLKRDGLEPTIALLEEVDVWDRTWQDAERAWIAIGRKLGWRLTNATDGGEGVVGLSHEARERITASWRGRKHRPETLAKLMAVRCLRRTSDATRQKMSASQRGRRITWAAKIGAAVRKLSAEQVTEIRERLASGESVGGLARAYGVHRTTISKVKGGTYRGS
jgi:hypothetical protein